MVDLRLKTYSGTVHPLLSVYLPFLFLYTVVVTLVGRAFTMYGIRVFPPFYFVILLLAGTAESMTSNFLYRERVSGFVPRLRELVVVLLVCFGLILLFYGDVTSGTIDLSRFNIWLSLIIVAAQWFFSLYVHNKLREREVFLGFFEGKEQRVYQGVYATHNHEGGESMKALKSLRKLVIGYIVVAFVVFVLMTWGVKVEFRTIDSILIFLLFTSFFLIASVLDRYMDMQRVMAAGHMVSRSQSRKKNATMILVFAVVALIALPISGRESLMPQSYLAAVLEWLSELGRRERQIAELKAPELNFSQQTDEIPNYLGQALNILGDDGGGTNIGPYIGYTLLGLLGIGFIFFLISPLLRIRRGGTRMSEAIRQYFSNMGESIRHAWTAFWASLARILRQSRKVGEFFHRVREQARAVAEAREEAAARRAGVSKRDRRIQSRVLKSFMRYAKWAKRYDVTFHPSIAPREFSQMVAKKVPEQQTDVLEIAEMFEEIIYSHHHIENTLQDRYHEKVAAVVRSR